MNLKQGRGHMRAYLARCGGYLSITSTVHTPPTHTPAVFNPLEPQRGTRAPTPKCIFPRQSWHYIPFPAAAVVTQNQRKIMVVWVGGGWGGRRKSCSGTVIFFTAGTNHYHFPDHGLCGNSPPYSLHLSHCCQSQRTN